MEYLYFASRVSFFEFIQSEFRNSNFNKKDYKDEFNLLKKGINIESLTKMLETNPKMFDIFESFFQLSRFTNAQYIHFLFDVNILNNSDDKTIMNYAEKQIFKFENGKTNDDFIAIYSNMQKDNPAQGIFNIKRAIVAYVNSILKRKNKNRILHTHIANSISSRLRIARYLVENLNADECLKSIDLATYLELKRTPIDTKSIHGKFGGIKIKKILDSFNISNIDSVVSQKVIDNELHISDKFKSAFCYLTERAISGIKKRKDGKLKVFDFILVYNKKPIFLIETNFYSTSGTKIGINQGEYADLLNDIKEYNRKNYTDYKFIWITDGNYWLSREGEERFNNLKMNFFKEEYELLNYNLFKEYLPEIMKMYK